MKIKNGNETVMVSTYETEARDFMTRNNIKMSIMFKDREANRLWRDNAKRNCYSVYIRNTNSGEAMHVTFWDSIYNTTHNITPTCYDILACLTKYDPGDYEDFCSEFGYETETENEFGRLTRNPNTYKIWEACCHEWEKVKRVFDEGEILEELREIN